MQAAKSGLGVAVEIRYNYRHAAYLVYQVSQSSGKCHRHFPADLKISTSENTR